MRSMVEEATAAPTPPPSRSAPPRLFGRVRRASYPATTAASDRSTKARMRG